MTYSFFEYPHTGAFLSLPQRDWGLSFIILPSLSERGRGVRLKTSCPTTNVEQENMQVVGMLNVEGTMPHAAGGAQSSEGCRENRDNQLNDSLPSGFINFHRHSNFGLSDSPPTPLL